ncbi:hypothetical protein KM043_006086 [Ampulex compressa]|nr:hypothetical protein KM043_006086 [Ampulex compressa]
MQVVAACALGETEKEEHREGRSSQRGSWVQRNRRGGNETSSRRVERVDGEGTVLRARARIRVALPLKERSSAGKEPRSNVAWRDRGSGGGRGGPGSWGRGRGECVDGRAGWKEKGWKPVDGGPRGEGGRAE